MAAVPHVMDRFGYRSAALAVAFIGLLSGINALGNALVLDEKVIIPSPAISGATGTAEIWSRDYWYHVRSSDQYRDRFYRPLTLQTLRWEYALHGPRPAGYHAGNLLLHSAAAGLVVLVAAAVGLSVGAAALAGLLFAVMPIHVDAIAGVVNRSDLLCTLFTLLTVWIAMRWRAESGWSTVGKSVVILLSSLAAVLSKETGVAAAVLGVLFVAADRGSARRRGALIGVVAASGLALGCYFALRLRALGCLVQPPMLAGGNVLIDATPAERFWGVLQLLGMYVQKTFAPVDLCFDYSCGSFGLASSLLHPQVLTGVLTLLLIGAGVVWWVRTGRTWLALCCAAILICYLPASNALVLGTAAFAERLWYLPSAFLVIAMLAAGEQCVAARPHLRRPVLVVTAVLAAAGLVRSWDRTAEWRDNGVLFASAYRVHPNSVTVMRLYGSWLADHDQQRAGIELLEKCVRAAPKAMAVYVSLGRAYLDAGQPGRAVEVLQQVTMSMPDFPGAAELLQRASTEALAQVSGQLEAARGNMERQPQDLGALLVYVDLLISSGQTPQALSVLEGRQTSFADRPAFHRALAAALMASGRRDDAIQAYRVCVKLQPGQAAPVVELIMALLVRQAAGDVQEASGLVAQAAQLAPQDSGVLVAQAEVDILQGRQARAAEIYERLARYAPTPELRDEFKGRSTALRGK
jgi:protein O-mannosyl-transferase